MHALWSEVTNILNSVPGGPAKDWKQWRKSWVDLKKNTKEKESQKRKYMQGTGGGPPSSPPSKTKSNIDEKILSIINPTSITGNDNVTVSEVQFDVIEPLDESVVFDGRTVMTETEETVQNSDKFDNLMDQDHVYCSIPGTSQQPSTAEIQVENQNSSTFLSTPGFKRKRFTKTARLTESMKNNDMLLKINKENLESHKIYREKKIEILLCDSKKRETYWKKKLMILESIGDSLNQMVDHKDNTNSVTFYHYDDKNKC
ncbi:uncharacterized protein LOC111692042 [Anoplophora glabripennis]|nr:uncharacterized protein LOC111692042 [Anoplophora glabripennis]